MRYSVTVHGYGRPMITRGPMAGCRGFAAHHHRSVGEFARKADAIACAQEQSPCAVVYDNTLYRRVFWNGKESEIPQGWTRNLNEQTPLPCGEAHTTIKQRKHNF